jgi:hypothetical protein
LFVNACAMLMGFSLMSAAHLTAVELDEPMIPLNWDGAWEGQGKDSGETAPVRHVDEVDSRADDKAKDEPTIDI